MRCLLKQTMKPELQRPRTIGTFFSFSYGPLFLWGIFVTCLTIYKNTQKKSLVNKQFLKCLYHKRLVKFEKGEKAGPDRQRKDLIARGSSDEQAIVHAWPGFIAANCTRSHLHASNGLFGGVIRPRNFWFPLKGTIALPVLTQT